MPHTGSTAPAQLLPALAEPGHKEQQEASGAGSLSGGSGSALRELASACRTLDFGFWRGEFAGSGWLLQKQQPKGRQQKLALEPGTPRL